MRVNQKTLLAIVITLSIITLILAILSIFQYVNIDVMMLFLGFTQLASGYNQITISKQINEQGKHKGNRVVGIISIILGIVIILMDCIKIFLI